MANISSQIKRPMRSILLLWSAIWRAQVTHLVLFALLPGATAVVRVAVGIVLLPFLLLGGGDRSISLASEVTHLSESTCWIALLPCTFAERTLYDPKPTSTKSTSSKPQESSTGTRALEQFIPLPTSFTVRHAWFSAWLLWFLVYLVRRERQRDA